MVPRNSALFSFPAAVLLCACTDQPDSPPLTAPAGQQVTTTTDFYTGTTIREIMDSLVDPQADTIWNSVRVISDATGIHEFVPETDADWAALRISAVTIIEGANALMIPGRRVAPPGAASEFPQYEFTPEEVQTMLDEDRLSWVGFAKGLQNSALGILEAIDNRDTDQLSDAGAFLDEACEACHSHYWYRAGI